ncbi:hypothetical protein C9F11_21090 [Streptomyces sp. YIM 121038]|uniref:DUF397 domain-containing protein n=1 Tax=Streptomyces sp. YIM 121038 TaxID=2136401 RepID=UPI00111097E4|nr:DUF397 domain-containing protein [Streptomyces sp. YIM 121038]QCX77850.1 hypothetical protein C9F11_21090 [Streptomyces sp. YIM 121038]
MAEQPQHDWFKSSYSANPDAECVECLRTPKVLWVRDSKRPHAQCIAFSNAAWGTFAGNLKDGGTFVKS